MTRQPAILYVAKPPEFGSLHTLVERAVHVCQDQRWEVAKVVRERDMTRPKLADLADRAERGELERVVFADWDAMAAGPGIEDWHPLVYRIHRAGVRVSLATV